MLNLVETWKTSATFSSCQHFRYTLAREWADPTNRCAFVMLNPSTADASKDDPTIRRCIAFSRAWGFGALDVVNLFAWRSTEPSGLLDVIDPVGERNDLAINRVTGAASRVVLAWGSHEKLGALLTDRAAFVRREVLPSWKMHGPLVGRLGEAVCRNGQPKHPLYLADSTPFVPWEAREETRVSQPRPVDYEDDGTGRLRPRWEF